MSPAINGEPDFHPRLEGDWGRDVWDFIYGEASSEEAEEAGWMDLSGYVTEREDYPDSSDDEDEDEEEDNPVVRGA